MNEPVFYKSNKNWERKLEEILGSDLSTKDKSLLESFSKRLLIEGISPARIKKHLTIISSMMRMVGKGFDKLTTADLENILTELNRRGYAYETKKDYKASLKKFLKFAEGEHYNPQKYAWIRLKNKKEEDNSLRISADDLPTQEEILLLLKEASPMMKAAIAMQTECALRPSELLSLRIGSLTFKENKTEITLEQSKTKRRLNWFFFADVYIRRWIDQHPHKGDNTAPLFPSKYRGIQATDYFTPEGYDKALDTLAKLCGIKKRVYPYLLRHYGITSMRKRGFPDELIAKTVGHSIDMIKRYEHLSHSENEQRYEEQIMNAEAGILVKGQPLPYKICNICSARNEKDAYFCMKCNIPLNAESLTESEKKSGATNDLIIKFLTKLAEKNPAIKKTWKEVIKSEGMEWLFETETSDKKVR